MIKESYAAYSCYTYTYLNIGGLEVDEEKVPRHETNRNPNPKSQKPQNGTKETHFNSIFQLNPIPDRDFSPLLHHSSTQFSVILFLFLFFQEINYFKEEEKSEEKIV